MTYPLFAPTHKLAFERRALWTTRCSSSASIGSTDLPLPTPAPFFGDAVWCALGSLFIFVVGPGLLSCSFLRLLRRLFRAFDSAPANAKSLRTSPSSDDVAFWSQNHCWRCLPIHAFLSVVPDGQIHDQRLLFRVPLIGLELADLPPPTAATLFGDGVLATSWSLFGFVGTLWLSFSF